MNDVSRLSRIAIVAIPWLVRHATESGTLWSFLPLLNLLFVSLAHLPCFLSVDPEKILADFREASSELTEVCSSIALRRSLLASGILLFYHI